jgi:hypothetical protein
LADALPAFPLVRLKQCHEQDGVVTKSWRISSLIVLDFGRRLGATNAGTLVGPVVGPRYVAGIVVEGDTQFGPTMHPQAANNTAAIAT